MSQTTTGKHHLDNCRKRNPCSGFCPWLQLDLLLSVVWLTGSCRLPLPRPLLFFLGAAQPKVEYMHFKGLTCRFRTIVEISGCGCDCGYVDVAFGAGRIEWKIEIGRNSSWKSATRTERVSTRQQLQQKQISIPFFLAMGISCSHNQHSVDGTESCPILRKILRPLS